MNREPVVEKTSGGNCHVKVRLLQAEQHSPRREGSVFPASRVDVPIRGFTSGGSANPQIGREIATRAVTVATRGEGVQTLSSRDDTGEDSLADLKQRMAPYPLSEFKLLGSAGESVDFGEDAEFSLMGVGDSVHRIVVAPREAMGNRVKFGLGWIGPNGDTLVHSKMAVENGNLIVVGADGSVAGDDDAHSTLLSVRVNCR